MSGTSDPADTGPESPAACADQYATPAGTTNAATPAIVDHHGPRATARRAERARNIARKAAPTARPAISFVAAMSPAHMPAAATERNPPSQVQRKSMARKHPVK